MNKKLYTDREWHKMVCRYNDMALIALGDMTVEEINDRNFHVHGMELDWSKI